MGYALFVDIFVNVGEREGNGAQTNGRYSNEDKDDDLFWGTYQKPTPL